MRGMVGVALAGLLLAAGPAVLAEADYEVDRINREVVRLVAKGWFDDATILADKAVRLAESTIDEEHPAFVESLRNLAGLRGRAGDDARSRALLERALEIQERSLGPNHPELVESLDDLADAFRATRSYDEAEALYRRALTIREEDPGSEDLKLVEPLSKLAGLHLIREEYGEAKAAQERIVEILEKSLGADHPDLVAPLKSLFAIHQAEGDNARAKALVDRALEIKRMNARRLPRAGGDRGAIGINVVVDPSFKKSTAGEKRMLAAKVYFMRSEDRSEPYGVANRIWSNYSWKERESFARRATTVLESNFRREGDVYLLNAEPGRYLAVGAVVIESVPGETIAYHAYFSSEIVAKTEVVVKPGEVVFMGDVRATSGGNPDPIQRYFLDAIRRPSTPVIDLYGLGPVHYKETSQWAKLDQVDRGGKSEAAFWSRTRNAFKFETTWLKLVPNRDSIGDPASPTETKLGQRNQRALDQMYSGDYKGAVNSAGKALELCESDPNAGSTCLAPTVRNLADILTTKNERATARPLYERALKSRQQALGPQHPAVASTLDGLARMHDLDGDREKARELGERALELFEASLGKDHPAVSDSLEFLASVHKAADDDEQATALIERALRVREDSLGWTHLTVVPLLNLLARQSLAANEHERTVELMERALAIHERGLGVHHRETGHSLYVLAQGHHGLGQYEQAAALLERALSIQTAAFGAKDRRVTDTMVSLATCYAGEDEAEKARRLRREANTLIQQKVMDDLDAIGNAIVRYAVDNGKNPMAADIVTLRQLLHPTYIRTMQIEDGWGNRYIVDSGADEYELRSLGKDGQRDSNIGGARSTFASDIVFADGGFRQWPEGPQR